jgi:hypothetical protein
MKYAVEMGSSVMKCILRFRRGIHRHVDSMVIA